MKNVTQYIPESTASTAVQSSNQYGTSGETYSNLSDDFDEGEETTALPERDGMTNNPINSIAQIYHSQDHDSMILPHQLPLPLGIAALIVPPSERSSTLAIIANLQTKSNRDLAQMAATTSLGGHFEQMYARFCRDSFFREGVLVHLMSKLQQHACKFPCPNTSWGES